MKIAATPTATAALASTAQYGRTRASLVAADPLLVALGRPNREQVLTTRSTIATTLQMLELANGTTLSKLLQQGDVNLAGPVSVLSEGEYPVKYPQLYIRPAEARAMFLERGWSTVAAFQTRNPMHRSHEHLVKIAVEVSDGVFIHQVLGRLKAGDIPAEVRTRAIRAMIDNYFRPGTVIQAGYPIEMRYAGPREALLHALVRQNFGCSHLIVGRDHAGVGNYYGPYDSQAIFDQLWPGALHTKPLKIDVTFYCRKCYGMATGKTCPHDPKYHIAISGTEQRKMLSSNAEIPPEFSRPEVVAILKEYYAGLKARD